MNDRSAFDWTVDDAVSWPPHDRPRPPFGVTAVEVMRSCPLRSCFERSSGYERRTGWAARVGTAFHRALERIGKEPPREADLLAVADRARAVFLAELAQQREEADARPRERFLPRDASRADRALEAVIYEARRIVALPLDSAETLAPAEPALATPAATVEIPIRSRDALLRGQVDRAERDGGRLRLVDYKSAYRADLPERYARQLQLYAVMWHDTFGEWPDEGLVVYPLSGAAHAVDFDPATCTAVMAESATLVDAVRAAPSLPGLATPGEVCQVCEFRPWCRAFWEWQAAEPSDTVALERSSAGLEGRVTAIASAGGHTRVQVTWRRATVSVILDTAAVPHVERIEPGDQVRVLDVRLGGLRTSPRAVATALTEIYRVL